MWLGINGSVFRISYWATGYEELIGMGFTTLKTYYAVALNRSAYIIISFCVRITFVQEIYHLHLVTFFLFVFILFNGRAKVYLSPLH